MTEEEKTYVIDEFSKYLMCNQSIMDRGFIITPTKDKMMKLLWKLLTYINPSGKTVMKKAHSHMSL